MRKSVNTSQDEMKPKLLHLPKDVIRILSIKAANDGTNVKALMQNILEKAAEQIKIDGVLSEEFINNK